MAAEVDARRGERDLYIGTVLLLSGLGIPLLEAPGEACLEPVALGLTALAPVLASWFRDSPCCNSD